MLYRSRMTARRADEAYRAATPLELLFDLCWSRSGLERARADNLSRASHHRAVRVVHHYRAQRGGAGRGQSPCKPRPTSAMVPASTSSCWPAADSCWPPACGGSSSDLHRPAHAAHPAYDDHLELRPLFHLRRDRGDPHRALRRRPTTLSGQCALDAPAEGLGCRRTPCCLDRGDLTQSRRTLRGLREVPGQLLTLQRRDSSRTASASRVSVAAPRFSRRCARDAVPGISRMFGAALRAQASATCAGEQPSRAATRRTGRAGAEPAPRAPEPRGENGTNAMPRRVHSSSTGCERRSVGW